jgi:hypothetical protein
MKKNFSPLLYIVLALVTITWHSCKKTDNPPTPAKMDPLEEKVTASVNGRVLDEDSKPVKDALVQSGTSTTTTDINGVFRFSNIQLSKNAGFVLVEKNGYFKGSRTIFTNAGVVNNIEIKLIPKKERGNFTASAGGTISIESGAAVNFSVNGVINKSTNAAYTGTVKVFGAYLNPEDPKLGSIMPGNLTGLTTNNEQKILQTYGMIAVELEGSNGEKLNLASGKSATITFPIPSSMLTNAPATIPLWYFNDTLGIWKEEGTATKQGNNYVGSVSHFSFWNCDVPSNFVNLKMTLKNQNQEILPGYRVVLVNTQNNSHAHGNTDSSGIANGAVPSAVPIEMTVYNKCNTILYTQTIGPFTTATDLGVVTITTPNAASITVSGTVLKCNNTPVANGYVDFFLEGNGYRAAVSNGNFTITIGRCSDEPVNLNLIAMDTDSSQQGSTTSLSVTSGNYTVNNKACGVSTEQFINYSFGGKTFSFLPAKDSLEGYRYENTTSINGSRKGRINSSADSANYQYTSFNFTGNEAPGVYTMSTGTFILSKGIPSSTEYNMEGSISITINEYGSSGQYVAGTFTGNMKERYTNAVVSGTGSFRIRRY